MTSKFDPAELSMWFMSEDPKHPRHWSDNK